MKVELLKEKQEKVFKPIKVVVTIESQEEMDALKDHQEFMITCYYVKSGMKHSDSKIIMNLVDDIYKEALDAV